MSHEERNLLHLFDPRRANRVGFWREKEEKKAGTKGTRVNYTDENPERRRMTFFGVAWGRTAGRERHGSTRDVCLHRLGPPLVAWRNRQIEKFTDVIANGDSYMCVYYVPWRYVRVLR